MPRDLIAIDAIPRKPSGKIDRRALPPPQPWALPHAQGQARSEEEELLIELWKQSLEEAQVGPETCFYAAGGTSLGAVRLCCAIERETGRFIDIGELAVHSTPRKLAGRLFGAGDGFKQNIVRLNSGSDDKTVFFLSGHAWNPNSLRRIATHLEDTASVVSVAPPTLQQARRVLRDTRATALYALEQIRAHRPSGPYYLLGYSYGGVIALEVARELRAAGEMVGMLVLLDSFLSTGEDIYKPAWRRALIHARQISRGGPGLLTRRIRERSQRSRMMPAPPAPHEKAGRLFEEAEAACAHAFMNYRPQPYWGEVLLLRCQEQMDHEQFTRNLPLGGWAAIIKGRLSVEKVQGDHFSILKDPHAGGVAEQVRKYLLASSSALATSPA